MKSTLFIAVILFVSVSAAQTQVPEADSLALVAFYDSTNGASWTVNTNWLQPGQPVSTWYGVTVLDDTVTEISLGSNNLVGSLPSEIGNFTGLKVLYLYDNELSGPIPSTIGNLSELTNLFLRKNHFSDSIPKEIGMLTNLYFLRLCQNELIGSIPEEIRNLTKLEYLLISQNELTGPIPEAIGNLSLLKQIDFSENDLSGPIPDSIGYLDNLKYLYIDKNQIDGLIPEEIGDLDNIMIIRMGSNLLSGSIPSSLGNLETLETIELFSNELTGNIPPEIGDMSKLEWLSLFENQLEGSIPPEIGNLDSLRILYLSNNMLEGSIPPEIGNLVKLESFSIWGNEISGEIPEEMGDLLNLKYLFMSDNQLSGEIPQELGQLNKLVYAQFHNNLLHGAIPAEIKDFPALSKLSVNRNYFNFADLEPIAGNTIADFSYNPQSLVELSTSQINVSTGDSLNFDLTEHTVYGVEASNNKYQWWKGGSSITDYADSANLVLGEIDDSDEGVYFCSMINSDFPDLRLETGLIEIIVDAPSDILLSSNSVDENSETGTIIGILSAEDPDQVTDHVFSLIAGDGSNDADNDVFTIEGDSLIIQTSPDYEIKHEYYINIRVTDEDSKTMDKAFIIYITDLAETNSLNIYLTDEIKAFPNPTGNTIFLSLPEGNDHYTYKLIDITGKIMAWEERYTGNEIDLKAFSAGVYYLRVMYNNKVSIIKILKE